MEKTLRILGLAAVAGAAVIIVAQSAVRAPAQGQSGSGDVAIASPQGSPYSNSVLTLLSMYFCRIQDREMELAKQAGKEHLNQPIIQACCAANLTLQTKSQHAATVASWEIERFAPNKSEWSAVVATPSMVNHLLKVSPAVNKKAEELIERCWAPIRNQQQELDKQIMATPEWKAARTKRERNIVHYNWMQAYRAKHPLPPAMERINSSIARYEDAISQLKPDLTADQRAELNAVIARYESSMKKAVRTSPQK